MRVVLKAKLPKMFLLPAYCFPKDTREDFDLKLGVEASSPATGRFLQRPLTELKKEKYMSFKKLAVLSSMTLALVVGLVIFSGSGSTAKAALATCSVPSGSYPTIQSAVNDVTCSTINVGPGTYNEQVTVARSNVTITGAGAGSTTIQPSTVTANTSSLFSGSPIAAIVLVDGASGVTMEDLTVDGSTAAPSGCAPTYVGIFYRAGSGAISDTHVTNIFNPAAPGCQGYLAIFVQSGNGGPGLNADVVIDGNTVDMYGKNGITANEAGTSVTEIGRASCRERV